jgi:hypothetical protein
MGDASVIQSMQHALGGIARAYSAIFALWSAQYAFAIAPYGLPEAVKRAVMAAYMRLLLAEIVIASQRVARMRAR